MTQGDSLQSLLLPSQRRENEDQEPVTPSNGGRASTEVSMVSQSSLNGMGSSGENPSANPSNTFSVSSEAGNEPVETEQSEDDKMLQLPPQFGKETRVLCTAGPHDSIPGEFTIEFHVVDAKLGKISVWLRAPEHVHLDFAQARCISLVCYPIQDIGPHTIQQGESRKHGFEILQPVPWTKVPPVLSFSMNDAVTHLFPHHEATEYLFDISRYVRLGQNKLRFSQVDSMSGYVVVVYSHYPTESQIAPLRARWDERKRFMEHMAWLVRPLPIPPPPNEWK